MEVLVTQTAPLVISIPERCETGKSLLKARADAVRAANIETWWAAEGKGWLKYCRHVAECDACQTYEMWKRSEQDKRFNRSKQ